MARLTGQRRVAETLAANAVATSGLTLQAGQLLLPNGTAAIPALAFSGDTDSGLAYVGGGVVHAFGGLTKMTVAGSQVAMGTEFHVSGQLIRFTERADPSAPPANNVYVYARDNGAGKTQVAGLFNTAPVQAAATEP